MKYEKVLIIALAALFELTTVMIVFGTTDQDEAGRGHYCSATTKAQFKACRHEKLDDFYIAKALCINISDDASRAACLDTAHQKLEDGRSLCKEQRDQRLEIC